jgi:hypothetical protein
MYPHYTPTDCHALPYISELTTIELRHFKLYINKIEQSVCMEYLLQYENVFK